MNLPPPSGAAGSSPAHAPTPPARSRLQRFAQTTVRGFHAYATWLVGLSWKRFTLLSLLLLMAAGILQGIPPFSIRTEVVEEIPPATPRASRAPKRPADRPASGPAADGLDISIDARGIRITPRAASAAQAPAASTSASGPPVPVPRDSAAADAGPAVSGATPSSPAPEGSVSVQVSVPGGVVSEAVRAALQEAAQEIRDALQESARESAREEPSPPPQRRVHHVKTDSVLPDLALLWILGSLLVKITYKGQMQARAQAARATEAAEAEQLRRQVVEARMAAMQAQVEPHFLFNTLASIDHLIETDPPRASRMQKSLIALLRATLPSLREGPGGPRALGQELAVIEPYLDILRQRMEDRLQTVIDVPEGLRSAELPPLMVQGLVENAIKHGLEPQPAGGTLRVAAEIIHGQLVVTVQDNGVGLQAAASSGSGTGLASIRERLALLYGPQARLEVVAVPTGGTRAQLILPYRTVGHTPQDRT